MGDAPCAPRSPAELAACAAGIDTLTAAGLLQPDEAEKRRDALKAEASAWLRSLELRRGSVGEGTSVTRLQPSVGCGPLSLAAPQPPPPAAKRNGQMLSTPSLFKPQSNACTRQLLATAPLERLRQLAAKAF